MRTVGGRIEGATGAVLCGGEGRRMGRPKGDVVLVGETLLARAVRTLAGLFDEVLVVGREILDLRALGPGAPAHARAVPDERPGQGPVGGIATALAAATRPWVFVCACDMPFLDARAILAIAEAVARTSDLPAVVPREGGNVQPLAAFYSREALPAAREAVAEGRLSATRFLGEIRAAYIDLDPGSHVARALTNVNTPEDLARAECEIAGLGTPPGGTMTDGSERP